ncbi:hypothetical protein ACFT30_13280 [Microbacterium ureisolvens]|uniref:hypothetical protein n=1 Tax=Microbacterium ureisolvens TaxID=2781186 RepID=UPI00364306C2
MIDPDDEQTVLSRRATPAQDADPESGKGSAESSPAAGVASDPDPGADEPLDAETTQVRRPRRRRPALGDPAPGARAPQSSEGMPADFDDTVRSARSGRAAAAELSAPVAESAPPGPRRAGVAQPIGDSDDDATVLVRGAQRSETADPRADSDDRSADVEAEGRPPAGRVAQSPGSAERVVYAARAVPTTPLVRSTPARNEPQPLVDTAATDATRRRDRRRRVIAVVAAASVALIVAVALLVALLTTG